MLGLIYAAGVAQGFFLIVALSVLKVKHVRARWLLVALISVLTTMLGMDAADLLVPGFNPPSLGLAIEFAFWPMLYLFVLELNNPIDRPSTKLRPHFLIASLSVVCAGYLIVSNAAPSGLFLTVWVAAKFTVFVTYAWLIQRELTSIKPLSTAIRAAKRWLRVCFVAFSILVAIVYADAFLSLAGAPGSWGTNIPDTLTTVIALFALGYFSLAHRSVLDRSARSGRSASESEVREIYQQVVKYLEDNEAFRNADLDLSSIANGIGVPKDKISHALNQIVDGGLVTILNEKRFQTVRAALRNPANKTRTVLDLAFEAGFNSKASFYRVFRAKEGVSPSIYRERGGFLQQSSA